MGISKWNLGGIVITFLISIFRWMHFLGILWYLPVSSICSEVCTWNVLSYLSLLVDSVNRNVISHLCHLLGLSSSMNVRIVYLDIMRPFAEHVLQGWVLQLGPYCSIISCVLFLLTMDNTQKHLQGTVSKSSVDPWYTYSFFSGGQAQTASSWSWEQWQDSGDPGKRPSLSLFS